ncbi:hypothetical protein ACFO3U_11975 [Flavobacterium ponti]|uniref:Uncharacterized protein n=1 Tax=Flavobacterium ponti TaxID=665133 RepID=A0ABV9P7H9_9FLAO
MKIKNCLLGFFFLLILSNCDKNESTNEFNDSLTIFGKNYSFVNYSKSESSPTIFGINDKISSNFLYVSENDFNNVLVELKEKFNIEYNKNNKIITFFGNGLEIRNINEIKGISVISTGEDGYFQEIFQTKGNNLNKLDKYSKSYDFLLTQHFGYMSKVINANNNSFVSIICLENSKINKRKGLKNKLNINNISILYPEIKNDILFSKLNISHACTECSGNDGFCAFDEGVRDVICNASSYIEDGGTEEGEEPICGRRQVKSDDEDIKGRDAMYYIKYFIFSNSTKGEEYVDMYYALSQLFEDNNLYNTNRDELKLLFDFIESKAIKFVFSDNSTIILNNSDATYLQSLINKYKVYDSSSVYQNIFNKFEIDLQSYKNKTKGEIIYQLNN